MFPRLVGTSAIALFISLQQLAAQEESVGEVQVVVQQWLNTMAEVQKEEDEWLRDKDVLKGHQAGLKAEIGSLSEQLEEAKIQAEKADGAEQEKLEERERLIASLDDLSTRVIKLENSFAELLDIIPKPLREDDRFATALLGFETTIKTDDRTGMKGVPGRLQTVLILMEGMEKFQNTVTVRKSLQTAADGKDYEMDVIYLGLAVAFAVNETGTVATKGEVTPDGWKFIERSELAPAIRQLVDSTTGAGEATFVNIPVTIQ